MKQFFQRTTMCVTHLEDPAEPMLTAAASVPVVAAALAPEAVSQSPLAAEPVAAEVTPDGLHVLGPAAQPDRTQSQVGNAEEQFIEAALEPATDDPAGVAAGLQALAPPAQPDRKDAQVGDDAEWFHMADASDPDWDDPAWIAAKKRVNTLWL